MTLKELEIVGAVAALLAFWEQVAMLLRWPLRWIVVSRELDPDATKCILAYLQANSRRWSGDGYYGSDRVYVRPMSRVSQVFSERFHFSNHLFLHGKSPIWYSWTRPGDRSAGVECIRYLRGTVAWDELCLAAADWDDAKISETGGFRFRVVRHGGESREGGASAPTATPSVGIYDGRRFLRWRPEDIGAPPPIPLAALSLQEAQEALVRDIARFVRSREWCEERGIPWRRGWLLHGPPGTGKTSFVRGIAVEHDMPIHLFDLGSMTNRDFSSAWEQMLRCTPCIALLEDLDGVYGVDREDGAVDFRAPRGEAPTFDALLQAIGGVASTDGVLLFVTSNHSDRLDPALRRGGRLDMDVEFSGIDRAGRVKMAARILGDGADAEAIADDPELAALSPADLQERLCRVALAERFGSPGDP